MHECPECGQACDCDGEDLFNEAAAEECDHDCDDVDEDLDDVDEDEDESDDEDDEALDEGDEPEGRNA